MKKQQGMAPKKPLPPERGKSENIKNMFGSQGPGISKKLDINPMDMLNDTVKKGDFLPDVAKAFKHVAETYETLTPTGQACPLRDMSEVASLLASSGGPILFGGSINMLAVAEQAVSSSCDIAKAKHVCEGLITFADLGDMLGTVAVNLDMSPAPPFQRGTKDAEVMVACLVAYWHRDCAEESQNALRDLFSNLVFEARKMGAGSSFMCTVLNMVEVEEKSRDAIGMSAYRKCLFLTDMLKCASNELKYPDAKTEADMLMKVFEENHVPLKGWSTDTMKRYFHIGRRLQDADMAEFFYRWEFLEQRKSLVDGITALRSAVGVAKNNAELAHVFTTLFLEQRSGLRRTLTGTTRQALSANQIIKTIPLRHALLAHMKTVFPKMETLIEHYMSAAYYVAHGVDELGNKANVHMVSDDDEEDMSDVEKTLEMTDEGISTYASYQPIKDFCSALMRNSYEKTLANMSGDGAGSIFLDLTTGSSYLSNSLSAILDRVHSYVACERGSHFHASVARIYMRALHLPLAC